MTVLHVNGKDVQINWAQVLHVGILLGMLVTAIGAWDTVTSNMDLDHEALEQANRAALALQTKLEVVIETITKVEIVGASRLATIEQQLKSQGDTLAKIENQFYRTQTPNAPN